MYYIGLMSGTSMDAVDAALVKFIDNKPQLIHYREYPIPKTLRQEIRQLNEESTLSNIAEFDIVIAELFSSSVKELLHEADINAKEIIAIGSHGQTVLHRPKHKFKTSIQIGDPNVISYQTGITTVADFRRMDMAADGEGAPLASAFHAAQFRQAGKHIIILNLGGMANITFLSDNEVIGFDTGPGNALLDDWIQLNRQKKFDIDGSFAKEGIVNNELLNVMLKEPYFDEKPPKSTGRELFNLQWLSTCLEVYGETIPEENIQRTLLELTITTIHRQIETLFVDVDEVIACGGGAYNPFLIDRLAEVISPIKLSTTENYGLSPNCIEAITFAWLAKQRMENRPANLPSVTGATSPVLLGGIYSAK